MDWNTILTVLTAIGGFEGIKGLVVWLVNRKNNKRVEEAKADSAEFGVLKETNLFLQEQLKEKEQRFCEQTDRLRQVQDDYFKLMQKNAQTELDLQRFRCVRKKCESREPQNGY